MCRTIKNKADFKPLEPIFSVNTSWLTCPHCGEEYGLHHIEAKMDKSRFSEGGSPTDDAIVSFWCENCSGLYNLRIIQFKGGSMIGWEQYGERVEGDTIIYGQPLRVGKALYDWKS